MIIVTRAFNPGLCVLWTWF